MRTPLFLLALALAGCAAGELEETLSILPGSNYVAPVLGGYPRPSGCGTEKCLALDSTEKELYTQARAKSIKWVTVVDRFYAFRSYLYPNTTETPSVAEMQSYQRAMAEQMDMGRLTESQWAYLIDKKTAEIGARNQALQNSAPRTVRCTTISVGTRDFPQFQTTCR